MKTTLGKKGLVKTWQTEFPETTRCVYCKEEARIGFVAHEGINEKIIYPRSHIQFVCDIHDNKGEGNLWLHDCCTVAVYFCKDCLKPTALYNQA